MDRAAFRGCACRRTSLHTNVYLAGSGQIDAAGTYSWPFPAWPTAVVENTTDGLVTADHHILILQSSVNNITGPQTGPCTLYETYQNTSVPSMFDGRPDVVDDGGRALRAEQR